MAPTGTRFEVEKFNGTGNFGLWQTRAKDLLAQQGCLKVLRDAKPAKMDAEDWEVTVASSWNYTVVSVRPGYLSCDG